MAHVKLEELYGMCHCCYGECCSEECNPKSEWCKAEYGLYEDCPEYRPRTRFFERDYKRFLAEESYDPDFWLFKASGKTRVCSYLEIDGHVYCDCRE